MESKITDIKSTLFTTKDGAVACDAITVLYKLAKKGSVEAKSALAEYVAKGPVKHVREFACSSLAENVSEADVEFADVFERGLSDPVTRYWSIPGYIRIVGREAYKVVAKIAADSSQSTEVRGHAVKCLAASSKQRFDRQLPPDPGEWKESDLRLSEIKAWAKVGYPDGEGYATPKRHPALDKPESAFEKIVSRFDKKLAKKRHEHQDLADPTGWLSPADPDDLRQIATRWKLPSVYLDFLTRFSPVKVTIESRKFYNHFQLFGAAELIEGQDGYSFNPIKQRPIKSWPKHLVVIASHGGDPFVLDLSESNGKDAPICTAEHGTGKWAFSKVADSFVEFLESLAK